MYIKMYQPILWNGIMICLIGGGIGKVKNIRKFEITIYYS